MERAEAWEINRELNARLSAMRHVLNDVPQSRREYLLEEITRTEIQLDELRRTAGRLLLKETISGQD